MSFLSSAKKLTKRRSSHIDDIMDNDHEYGVQGVERVIEDHKLNGLNEALELLVVDKPGPGGACHEYFVTLHENADRSSMDPRKVICEIIFQKGPVKEAGFNGLTNEVLLAVVIDRLRGFQSGPFASKDNEMALTACCAALDALQRRTRERLARGVEGTHEV